MATKEVVQAECTHTYEILITTANKRSMLHFFNNAQAKLFVENIFHFIITSCAAYLVCFIFQIKIK